MVSLFNILFFNKLYNYIVQYSEFLVKLVFINTIRNKCKGITAILMYLNKAWIDEKNDLLLSELCDRLREKTGINVSITTMHRAL